ncbi:DUF1559 family PulG-like putative transporter [Aeoliella mucimassa]|uniref:DUF1559 domain-containing protein n=1 Tax=Aeoliella mucimassa TaxID=2527972 RepID=A0A518AIC2_9BACT|nr:DUF1559 domain-containing protein [Aeoliella mucimassa]QDU54450.1 hypothetical protein Pan181_06320 [Aeoliella mucimassa]
MPRYAGFTLVELLVVIAIIGVLIALLLPAVQAAREASNRAACKNNLRQLGIAMHGFHDTKGHFPRGGGSPKKAQVSWTTELLPWLEEQPLADLIDHTEPYTSDSNLPAGSRVIDMLLCPSKPHVRELRGSADLSSSSPNRYGPTCYGGMQGERGLRSAKATNNPERGTMIFEREISIVEITDGTSHTMLLGEAPEGIHGIWIGVRNLFDQSAPINTRSGSEDADFTDFGQELSSYHPGGAQVLLADGGGKFFPEEMDDRLLAAYCSRASED